MNKNILLCIAALLLYLPLFSQENILLRGKVVADSLNQSAINILNFTQKTGTTNNTSGDFEIRVRKGDTLIFSSVQYQVIELVITPEILKNQFLQVNLSEKVNMLKEVPISNINLTGNLSHDLEKMKIFSQADIGFPFSTKPVPTLIQRKMSSATGSALELLINTLNGRIKMLKKAEEFMKFDAFVDRGIEAVTTEFFTDNLQIPKDEIINFVSFCAGGGEYKEILIKGDHLKLMQFYQTRAPEFIASLKNSLIHEK